MGKFVALLRVLSKMSSYELQKLLSAWGVDLGRSKASKTLIISPWNDYIKNLGVYILSNLKLPEYVWISVIWEIMVESPLFPTVSA